MKVDNGVCKIFAIKAFSYPCREAAYVEFSCQTRVYSGQYIAREALQVGGVESYRGFYRNRTVHFKVAL